MYNLPYISYGIFAFVLIATGLLAWKKGFKAAIASFVLTVGTTGLIVGLTLALYSDIAPLFKTMILKAYSGNSQFDFSAIADAAKPQVVAICIAIGFIPVFAILFGITYPVYRAIKKRDFPVTLKKISANVKKIKPQNKKANKAGAIVVTSLTAVASGAIVSTATSAALTTSKSFNIFNKISGWITEGATFGFGYDNLSLHKMYDFIPLTNDFQMLTDFASIIFARQDSKIDATRMEALLKNDNFNKLLDLFEDSETSVFLDVLKTGFTRDQDVISYESLKDSLFQNKALWRPLGNESSTNVYSLTLDEIEKEMNDAKVSLGLSESTINKIIEWMRTNAIQKFEDTEAYAKWKKGMSALDDLNLEKNEILNRINAKNVELRDAKAALEAVKADALKHRNELLKNIDDLNKLNIVGGDLDNKIIAIDNATATLNQKKADLQVAQDNLSNYVSTTYKAASDVLSAAKLNESGTKTSFDNATSAYNKNISDISAAKANKAQQESILSNATNQRTAKQNALNTLNSQLTTLKSQTSSLQQAKDTAQTNYDAKNTELTQATSDVSSAQTNLTNLTNELNALKQSLASATTQAEKDSLNTQITSKQAEVTSAQTALNNAKAKESKTKTELDGLRVTLNNTTSALAKNQQDIQVKESEIASTNADITSLTATINDATQNISQLTSQISTLESPTTGTPYLLNEMNRLKGDYNLAKSVTASAQTEFNKVEVVKNDLTAKQSAAQAAVNNADATLSSLNNDKASMEAKIVELGTKINAFAKTVFESDNSSRVEKTADVKTLEWLANDFSTNTFSAQNLDALKTQIQSHVALTKPTFTEDNLVHKNLSSDYSKSYVDSIPFLTNKSGTELTKVEDAEATDANGNKVYFMNDNPSFGTIGLLERTDYTIQSATKSAGFMEQVKTNKQNEFNANVEKYLEILRKHFR